MDKNYTLDYKKYKHLVNSFLASDFLNEHFNDTKDLIKCKNLLTEDNVSYFIQNIKRSCKIPLGIKKEDGELKFLDLLEDNFEFRHSDIGKLSNLAKNIICTLLQNYNPDEYEVYHDLDEEYLQYLNNFHKVKSTDELDSIYNSIFTERHNRYTNEDSFGYKDYRKTNKDKLIIFLVNNDNNVQLLGYRYYNNDNMRHRIACISFEHSEVFDSSTMFIDSTVRPSVDKNVMKDEIEIYKRMLSKYINSKDLNNLFTGEIIGDKKVLINLPLNEESMILEFCNTHHNYCNLSSSDGAVIYDKIILEPLRLCPYLGEEVCKYIIKCSIYTFICRNTEIQENLKYQYDLTDSDKSIIDKFIDRVYVSNYKVNDLIKIDMESESYSKYVSCDRILYETTSCKLKIKNGQLLISLNGKDKYLPQGLINLFNHKFEGLDYTLLNIIITYESYTEYGVHLPDYVI